MAAATTTTTAANSKTISSEVVEHTHFWTGNWESFDFCFLFLLFVVPCWSAISRAHTTRIWPLYSSLSSDQQQFLSSFLFNQQPSLTIHYELTTNFSHVYQNCVDFFNKKHILFTIISTYLLLSIVHLNYHHHHHHHLNNAASNQDTASIWPWRSASSKPVRQPADGRALHGADQRRAAQPDAGGEGHPLQGRHRGAAGADVAGGQPQPPPPDQRRGPAGEPQRAASDPHLRPHSDRLAGGQPPRLQSGLQRAAVRSK